MAIIMGIAVASGSSRARAGANTGTRRSTPLQSSSRFSRSTMVLGSKFSRRILSVRVRPGDIGDSSYRRHGLHFWAERIFDRFEHSSLQIKVSQIIIHKAHQPNVVVDFSDADGLT